MSANTLRSTEPKPRTRRKLILTHIKKARAAFDETASSLDDRSWRVRRQLKKVEALGSVTFGKADCARLHRPVKRVSRNLAKLRDANVSLENLAALRQNYQDAISMRTYVGCKRALRSERCKAISCLQNKSQSIHRRLEKTSRLIRKFRIIDPDNELLPHELASTYRKAKNAFKKAETDQRALHVWRKHLKQHRIQLQFLGARLTDRFSEWVAALKVIEIALGEHQDLFVLREKLLKAKLNDPGVPTVVLLINIRLDDIGKEALISGRRFFTEKAKDLEERLTIQLGQRSPTAVSIAIK